MVWCTRSQCYDSHPLDDSTELHRPAKRRRVDSEERQIKQPRFSSSGRNSSAGVLRRDTHDILSRLTTHRQNIDRQSMHRNLPSDKKLEQPSSEHAGSPKVVGSPPAFGKTTDCVTALADDENTSLANAHRSGSLPASQPSSPSTDQPAHSPDATGAVAETEPNVQQHTLEKSTPAFQFSPKRLRRTSWMQAYLQGGDYENDATATTQTAHEPSDEEDIARTNLPTDVGKFFYLGPAISPPSAPCTPPECPYGSFHDRNFGQRVKDAFRISEMSHDFRQYKYGADVADEWKRGFTPEESRQQWVIARDKSMAEFENVSDSDEEITCLAKAHRSDALPASERPSPPSGDQAARLHDITSAVAEAESNVPRHDAQTSWLRADAEAQPPLIPAGFDPSIPFSPKPPRCRSWMAAYFQGAGSKNVMSTTSKVPNESDEEDRQVTAESPTGSDRFFYLGPAITPPSAPCTPPEFVHDPLPDRDFSYNLELAFRISALRHSFRQDKYGDEIADTWKRGWTPEEAREKWRSVRAQQQAEFEQLSDSEDDLRGIRERFGLKSSQASVGNIAAGDSHNS